MPSIATRASASRGGWSPTKPCTRHVPIIATDAVGAAAGGLVRHERNGLVVPGGRRAARSAGALPPPARRRARCAARLGANAARDVAAFTFDAWAAGFRGALQHASSHGGR